MLYDPLYQIFSMPPLRESTFEGQHEIINEDLIKCNLHVTLARVYYQCVSVWVLTHPFETSVKSNPLANRDDSITFTVKDEQCCLYIFNVS